VLSERRAFVSRVGLFAAFSHNAISPSQALYHKRFAAIYRLCGLIKETCGANALKRPNQNVYAAPAKRVL